jgi:hypothetical protein
VKRKLETPAQRQARLRAAETPEQREDRLEYQRRYYLEHRTERLAYMREYRSAGGMTSEQLDTHRRERYRARCAARLECQRGYYLEHRDERLAYMAQYNQARRDREHASEAEYREWFRRASPAERIAYQKAVREKRRPPTGPLDAAEVRSLVGVRGRLRKLTPALAEAVGAWLHAQGWRAEAEQGLYWAPPDVVAVHGDPPPKSWCDLHLQLAARRALEST